MTPSLWLVDLALKSTALLLGAGLLTLALSRRSAALRHLIWGLALGAALALPILSLAAPQWSPPVALPMPGEARAAAVAEAVRTARPDGQASAPAMSSMPSVASELATARSDAASQDAPRRVEWAVRALAVVRAVAAGWTRWLVPLWAAGGAVILVGLALAVWRTRRLRAMAHPAPVEAQELGYSTWGCPSSMGSRYCVACGGAMPRFPSSSCPHARSRRRRSSVSIWAPTITS